MKIKAGFFVLMAAGFLMWRQDAFAEEQKAASGGIEVLRMVLCQDVKDREPQQELNMAKVGNVVVGWTQIKSEGGETSVTHRWLLEGEPAGDVLLQVKGSPWRTWSRKTISEAGHWKWQVLGPNGDVVKELEFTAAP